MNKLDGMIDAFKEAKQVFLTTVNSKGESHIRPMTNFNDSPYQRMWFPSFKETRKIDDIKENPVVTVSFPAAEQGQWYKVKGKAKLASWDEVRKLWRWWLLEWLPEKDRQPLRYDDPFQDRAVIFMDPIEAQIDDSK
jgi:general stress protein 26